MAHPVTTPRDPATATPKRFIIARWMFPTQRAHRPWEGDPIYEMSYDTRERIVIAGLLAVLCVYFLLSAIQGVAALIGG